MKTGAEPNMSLIGSAGMSVALGQRQSQTESQCPWDCTLVKG